MTDIKNLTKQQSAIRAKAARSKLQWTQRELAAKLMLNKDIVSKFENLSYSTQMRPADLAWLENEAKKVPFPKRFYVVEVDIQYGDRELTKKHLVTALNPEQAMRHGLACSYHGDLEEDASEDMALAEQWHNGYIFDGEVAYERKGVVEVK